MEILSTSILAPIRSQKQIPCERGDRDRILKANRRRSPGLSGDIVSSTGRGREALPTERCGNGLRVTAPLALVGGWSRCGLPLDDSAQSCPLASKWTPRTDWLARRHGCSSSLPFRFSGSSLGSLGLAEGAPCNEVGDRFPRSGGSGASPAIAAASMIVLSRRYPRRWFQCARETVRGGGCGCLSGAADRRTIHQPRTGGRPIRGSTAGMSPRLTDGPRP